MYFIDEKNNLFKEPSEEVIEKYGLEEITEERFLELLNLLQNPVLTIEEKINLALSKLKRNTNYEAPTNCLGIDWVGGYDSAQMLNAKRTLCLEVELESCTFTDNNDIDHNLSLEQAKEVCIKIAYEFEKRRAIYKMKKRTIELCTTIEELEAIEI